MYEAEPRAGTLDSFEIWRGGSDTKRSVREQKDACEQV